MKIFNSLGHAFAWLLSHIVPAAKEAAAVATDVAAIGSPLAKVLADVGVHEGAQVQADIEAVAGCVISSAAATGEAIGAKGLNIEFDEAAIAAIGRLVATVGGLFGKPPAKAS